MQQVKEIGAAYDLIKSQAKSFTRNVDLITVDALVLVGQIVKEIVTSASTNLLSSEGLFEALKYSSGRSQKGLDGIPSGAQKEQGPNTRRYHHIQ